MKQRENFGHMLRCTPAQITTLASMGLASEESGSRVKFVPDVALQCCESESDNALFRFFQQQTNTLSEDLAVHAVYAPRLDEWEAAEAEQMKELHRVESFLEKCM